MVVVSYNSRDRLRACVEPISALPGVNVFVVDNASSDGCLETVDDLPVTLLPQADNGGFARGCNTGWRAGGAEFVLLLNPDAIVDEPSLRTLLAVLEENPAAGAVAPKILRPDGSFEYSLRRFPRLRSTFAQAMFVDRLLPRARWADEMVRDHAAYERAATPEWVTGACILLRRTALEALGGLDERFFLYCEDVDLCRRTWDAGYSVHYEPSAVAVHVGGASAPRPTLFPILAESRVAYARKHRGRLAARAERVGIALEAATHMLVARGGRPSRSGHALALRRIASTPTRTARSA